jgi:hypothetical protein
VEEGVYEATEKQEEIPETVTMKWQDKEETVDSGLR